MPFREFLLYFVIVSAALTWVWINDERDTKTEDANYCAMVEAFRHSPRYGWPDYKGEYDAVCAKETASK